MKRVVSLFLFINRLLKRCRRRKFLIRKEAIKMAYNPKRAQEAEDKREELRQQLTEEAIHSIRQYTKDPDDVLELANFMANFHQYSMKNQLLIQSQFEGATAVAGFKQFQKLGYHVRKGEKAIKIFSPIKDQYIVPEDGSRWIHHKKWTKEQRRQVRNNEVKTRTRIHWKMSSVFDISQTDMPKEEAPKLLPNRFHTFDMSHVQDESKLYQSLVNVAQSKGIHVQVESFQGAAKGYAGRDANGNIQITLNNRLDQTNRIPTLIHEMTHSLMHFDEQNNVRNISKAQAEFQAEFSSYMTCRAFNIDTSEKAIPYIANWTNQLDVFDDEELVDFLEETEKVSRNIIRLTNNEWDRLTEQEREKEEMIHHFESYERQEIQEEKTEQEENQKNSQSIREEERSNPSIGTVLLAGTTTLEMIKRAKEESRSKLMFNIQEQNYILMTDKKAGESSLIMVNQPQQGEESKRIIGEEKAQLLTKIEKAGYLPMQARDYETMDQLKAQHRYPNQQDYPFLNHADSQNREKFNRLNQDYNSKTGLLNQPFISIEWSENESLTEGQILTLEEAMNVMDQLAESESEGYFKTQLNLHITPNEYYSTRMDMGENEPLFMTQLEEAFPRQMQELEVAQITKETESIQDPDEWEMIKVNTEFKGHQFQYDIQVNRVDHEVKGTYTRDQEAPKEATEKSCLNALQYVLDNHELDDSSRYLLEKTIENYAHREERAQNYRQNQERLSQIPSRSEETTPSKEQPSKSIESLPWKEQVKKAKSVNILELAEASGIHLLRDSRNQYRDADNHSMVFTPSKNSFYENNGQYGGDPITFVQKVVGISNFKEAVNYINQQNYQRIDLSSIPQKEPYQYDSSKESKTFDQARHYLVEERAISPQLVDKLHEMGLIRQDKRNNVLFLWTDNQHQIQGCTEQGTVKMKQPINDRDHWKAIQRNSETGEGFNFGCGQPEHLKFFESSIDALSYASIHGLENNTHYIAMDGLKESTVLNFIQRSAEQTQNHIHSIELCVDNDESGQRFINKFNQITQLNDQGEQIPIQIKGNTPQIPKEMTNREKWDWNNEAVFQKEKKQLTPTQSLDRE